MLAINRRNIWLFRSKKLVCNAGWQEVSRCYTRVESEESIAKTEASIREIHSGLKPRADTSPEVQRTEVVEIFKRIRDDGRWCDKMKLVGTCQLNSILIFMLQLRQNYNHIWIHKQNSADEEGSNVTRLSIFSNKDGWWQFNKC